MRPLEAMLVLGLCALLLWGIWSILAWLWSRFFSAPKPLELAPEEELARALKIAREPRPVFGTGQWMAYRCEPVFVDAPVQRGEIEVHDPTAPNHNRKTCKFCNERPNYSGASYRPAN